MNFIQKLKKFLGIKTPPRKCVKHEWKHTHDEPHFWNVGGKGGMYSQIESCLKTHAPDGYYPDAARCKQLREFKAQGFDSVRTSFAIYKCNHCDKIAHLEFYTAPFKYEGDKEAEKRAIQEVCKLVC